MTDYFLSHDSRAIGLPFATLITKLSTPSMPSVSTRDETSEVFTELIHEHRHSLSPYSLNTSKQILTQPPYIEYFLYTLHTTYNKTFGWATSAAHVLIANFLALRTAQSPALMQSVSVPSQICSLERMERAHFNDNADRLGANSFTPIHIFADSIMRQPYSAYLKHLYQMDMRKLRPEMAMLCSRARPSMICGLMAKSIDGVRSSNV